MKKIEVSDQIHEDLVSTGDGDADYGLIIFWETGIILTRIVYEWGMISYVKEEVARRMALRETEE